MATVSPSARQLVAARRRGRRGTLIVVTAEGVERRYRFADDRLADHAATAIGWHHAMRADGAPGRRRIATVTSYGHTVDYLGESAATGAPCRHLGDTMPATRTLPAYCCACGCDLDAD